MGLGTAWGGRLPCKEDIQVGSIPTRSTIKNRYPHMAVTGIEVRFISYSIYIAAKVYLRLSFQKSHLYLRC